MHQHIYLILKDAKEMPFKQLLDVLFSNPTIPLLNPNGKHVPLWFLGAHMDFRRLASPGNGIPVHLMGVTISMPPTMIRGKLTEGIYVVGGGWGGEDMIVPQKG